MENMDKVLTIPKWVVINCLKMPQNLSAQIVCPIPTVWDFDEKRRSPWLKTYKKKLASNIFLFIFGLWFALYIFGLVGIVFRLRSCG